MALTTSRGVLPSTKQPCQLEDSKPTSPVSATVATSGSAGERLAPATASARSVPAATCGSVVAMGAMATWISPVMSAGKIPASPLYGTGWMSMPAAVLNISMVSADTGHAVVETARLGLRERDQFRDRGGGELRACHQHELGGDELRHRDEVAHDVEGERAIDGGADRRAVRVLQDGVTVGRRFRDGVGGDIAARPRTVLDDDRLAQRFGELGADHASERVDSAAGDEGDHDADRLARIGLTKCAARMKRECREREREPQPFHRCHMTTAPHRPLPRLRGRDREGDAITIERLTSPPPNPSRASRGREQTGLVARGDSISPKPPLAEMLASPAVPSVL